MQEMLTVLYICIGVAIACGICFKKDDYGGGAVLSLFWPMFLLGVVFIILNDWWRGQ